MAPFAQRPFRTVVSAPITQLLESYNAAAEQLRPSVAQIFNVPELAGLQRHATAADSPQGWPALLKDCLRLCDVRSGRSQGCGRERVVGQL